MLAAPPKTRTCLWFADEAREAAELYVSLLPDSRVDKVTAIDDGRGTVVVELTLSGTPFQFLQAGPHYAQSPAASIAVTTDDQAETDRLWAALLAGGGAELACGWLTDRFGVTWQITPKRLLELLDTPDVARAERVRGAMYQMKKIEIAGLEEAAATETTS